jgi:hypothetical protein
MTRRFDCLHAQFAGRPIAELKATLKRQWDKGDGSITEPELLDYAQMISGSNRIPFAAGTTSGR